MGHQNRHHTLECYGTPMHTLEGMLGICYRDFPTDSLPTCLHRIVVCYTWGFVGYSGLQCFTSGTLINYR